MRRLLRKEGGEMKSGKQRRGRKANEIIGGTMALTPACTSKALEIQEKRLRKVLRSVPTTKITLVRAVEVALERTPGSAIKAEIEVSQGAATWHVHVVGPEGRLRSITIEDETGTIVTEE
jgi:uncharacterized membrane protein YkoI